MVENVVIATDSARSAFKRLHHQLEYDPPGEETTTSRVIPIGTGRENISITAQPINGNRKNWQNSPNPMALQFFSCAFISFMLTVEARPITKRKSRRLVIT
jgi:hypothetical protein